MEEPQQVGRQRRPARPGRARAATVASGRTRRRPRRPGAARGSRTGRAPARPSAADAAPRRRCRAGGCRRAASRRTWLRSPMSRRWSTIDSRSPSAKRPASAASPRARSSWSAPTSMASSVAPADLRPDPLGARRRGEDEPALGARSEPEEGGLVGARGLRPRVERVARPLGIVRGIDAWVARRGERMAGDLAGAVTSGVGDDELVAVDSHPDPLADEPVGHRVAGRAEAEGRVVIDGAGHAEGDRVGLGRDRVQPPALGRQPVDRRLAGLAVRSGVDALAERVAGGPQLGERAVRREQVGLGRHEIGFGERGPSPRSRPSTPGRTARRRRSGARNGGRRRRSLGGGRRSRRSDRSSPSARYRSAHRSGCRRTGAGSRRDRRRPSAASGPRSG